MNHLSCVINLGELQASYEIFTRKLVGLDAYLIIEECHTARGKQTCSCFEAQLKFVNFYILQQKMSQHIVFNLVFNESGVCHYCTFCILKVKVKKAEKFNFCEV